MARITKKKFKAACTGSGGVGTVVAKAIGVTRGAIYHYLEKHPEMRKFLDEEGKKIIDVAEHNVDKEIVAGNIDVSQWALTNRKEGKARGYGPRQEMEQVGKSTIIQLIEMSDREIKDEKLKHKQKLTKDKDKQKAKANHKSPRR